MIQVDSGVPAPAVDHNLIDGFRGYPGEIWGADHVEGLPGFVASPAADYHLVEGSPAIDAGSSMAAPADDFDGVLRPQGAGYDIGAYELGQGAANPTLTVTKAGSGTGTVTSNPAGINCGADCSEPYPTGTQVSLSIAPAAGSTFAGWSGGGCSGTSACVVTLNSSTTVTATFNAAGVGNCTPNATTLCLNNNRFKVQVDWETGTGMGEGQVVPGGTGDSSNLWFFSPNNWEMLFKVLDGCAINNHYWVFFAATTDVGFTVTVTDTQEDEVTVYSNPLGQAANAVTDTSAFATCP